MLNLYGRSPAERAKSIALGLFAVLLSASAWQISDGRAQPVREQQDRETVTAIARGFAIALTTYDYAHPNVQRVRIATVSSSDILARVTAATSDIAQSKASSLGEATYTTVVTLSSSRSEVLVGTAQVVSGAYTGSGSELAGLLCVTVGRSDSNWLVVDFRWLQAPGGAP
jgi:hypothetical protein